MDLILLISVAISLLLILLTILYFRKKDEKKVNATVAPQRGIQIHPQENIPRRAQIARNQRLRTRNAIGNAGEPRIAGGTSSTSIPVHQQPIQQQQHSDNDDNVGTERAIPDFGDEKIGTKKRAKLEAKAEKKAQREQELKIREDRKKQELLNEEERRKQEEKEKEEEKKLEETERLAREEKEQRELEEYLKMKEAFSVEEEGYEDDDDDEKVNLLQEFINYIKDNKIVVLEDLASNFKLKTQAAIDRIHDLQKEGHLTGVIDDRGKFIYISEDELNSVAKFIRQRGRISITELAESSNNLINLMPVSG